MNQNIHDSILQFERLFPHDMQDRLLLEKVLLIFRRILGVNMNMNSASPKDHSASPAPDKKKTSSLPTRYR
ncbi:MAG: hypothetical protein IJK53_05410 [Erysipelotrichaceae bacterium]|nr:hypothetical protein [Erysipelotrichaceae bacterium]